MSNPRDITLDIVGNNKLGRATAGAERDLDKLERKIRSVDDRSVRATRSVERMHERMGKTSMIEKFGDKLESASGTLLKIAGGAGAALPALGALQPVIIGLTGVLAPAAAALGVFGGVLASVFGSVSEASQKNQDLLDKMQLAREKAKVYQQRGDSESAAKELDKAAKAAVELRARYNLLDPAQRKAVMSMDKLKMTWQDFIDKNTPRVVNDLARAFEFLIRTIPKLQPLFNAGADAAEDFLGFIERKERDGTIDRFIDFLAKKAPGALQTVAGALDTTWGALQTAWVWWGKLATAVERDVDDIKLFVYGMQHAWYSTLAAMYSDSAEFLRNTAAAFDKMPGAGHKVAAALREAAAGLDQSANVARQKAADIQNSIDRIHGKEVDVRIHYTGGEGLINGPWTKDGGSKMAPSRQSIAFSAGTDLAFADAGSRSTMPAQPITVSGPDVYTSVHVTIPGLADRVLALVDARVDARMRAAAGRLSSRRAYA